MGGVKETPFVKDPVSGALGRFRFSPKFPLVCFPQGSIPPLWEEIFQDLKIALFFQRPPLGPRQGPRELYLVGFLEDPNLGPIHPKGGHLHAQKLPGAPLYPWGGGLNPSLIYFSSPQQFALPFPPLFFLCW